MLHDAIAIAEREEVTFTTFGDMLRVPGSRGSLLDAKARGADVRIVYSPLDALRIARDLPEREVVFFGIGFETTAPSTLVERDIDHLEAELSLLKAVLQAEREETAQLRARLLGSEPDADARAIRDRWATLVDHLLLTRR